MRLAITALILGMTVSNATSKKTEPKAPVESFSHKYFVQLDKVNAALRDYTNTPCREPEFIPATDKVTKEYNLLSGMYQNIPLDEDEITRAHEQEVFLGVEVLAKISVDMQNQCLKNDSDPNHSRGN